MNVPTLLAAGLLAFGLAACTDTTTPLQSGGSGMSDTAVGMVAYDSVSPYATPGKAPGCAQWDDNCNLLYNDPGGGD